MDEIRCYMRQLFTALVALNEKGIMHRDIKPSNFMYNFHTNKGMLTDFGLAQVWTELSSSYLDYALKRSLTPFPTSLSSTNQHPIRLSAPYRILQNLEI